MKDEHLTTALRKALTRFGTSELPADAHVEDATRAPRRPSANESRRRTPGWVTVSEIEAAQSPNSYPRLTRRAIKTRCKELAREDGTPVEEVRAVGLRTWVRIAAPSSSAREDANPVAEPVVTDLVTDLVTDVGPRDLGQPDSGGVGHADQPAAVRFDLDVDLDLDHDLDHDPSDRV